MPAVSGADIIRPPNIEMTIVRFGEQVHTPFVDRTIEAPLPNRFHGHESLKRGLKLFSQLLKI